MTHEPSAPRPPNRTRDSHIFPDPLQDLIVGGDLYVPAMPATKRGPFHSDAAKELPQHLIWRTIEHAPLLANPCAAEICLNAFEIERRRLQVDVYGYCLMPDHVHLVIGPCVYGVGTCVQWMKLASTHALKIAAILKTSPWSRGYWDRALRTEREVLNVLAYVHENPVKAGLCEKEDEFPFASGAFYICGRPSPLRISPPF